MNTKLLAIVLTTVVMIAYLGVATLVIGAPTKPPRACPPGMTAVSNIPPGTVVPGESEHWDCV
jgi:hypothetical protein